MGSKDIPADRWERLQEAKISAAVEKEKQRKAVAAGQHGGSKIGEALHGWAEKLSVLEPDRGRYKPTGFNKDEQRNLSRFIGETLARRSTDAWNAMLEMDRQLQIDDYATRRHAKPHDPTDRNMRQPNISDLDWLAVQLGDKIRETYPGFSPEGIKKYLETDTDK